MLKLFKFLFIFTIALLLCGSLFIVSLIKLSHVDELLTHYPRYDLKIHAYVLDARKPKDWVKLDQVAEYAKWAIVLSEDWAFFDHPGVDLNQLKVALKDSLEQGEFTRGASTITQQVIKNAVLSDERTLWRKFQEIILALYLEKIASKERILEIYLNIIHLGEDIYGISQGADFYFNKKPIALNAREGAFLAMLLPSPVKYASSFYQKELSEFASSQVDSILIKLRQADIYDEEERLNKRAKGFIGRRIFIPLQSLSPAPGRRRPLAMRTI